MSYVFGPERERNIRKDERRGAKKILIFCCIFAVISFSLMVAMLAFIPQLIKNNESARYLYEHGVEVDASIVDYRYNGGYHHNNGGRSPVRFSGYYIVEIEYVNYAGRVYHCDFKCLNYSSYEARAENGEILRQMAENGETFTMLIDDRGGCCWAINKGELIKPTGTAIIVSIICVSAVVLGLSIFGIVKQSKKLKK